jgi:hypothetical protein
MIGRVVSWSDICRDGDVRGADGRAYWINRTSLTKGLSPTVNMVIVFNPADPDIYPAFKSKMVPVFGCLNARRATSIDLMKALLRGEAIPEPLPFTWANPYRNKRKQHIGGR